MSASIWAPGSELVVVDAESTNLSQIFTASAGQTVFNLTEYSYTPNTGSIAVYRGGQKLVLGIDYTETSSSSVTLQGISPAAGETFEVIAIIGSASAFAGQAEASAVIAVASAAAALHPWEAEAEGIHYDLGNVRIGGIGKRITGDFSNATIANRVMFQTSVANGNTFPSSIPNGTGAYSGFSSYNVSDPANSSRLDCYVGPALAYIDSTKTGTGTYLPMTFYTGGSERMRIDTSGNVLANSGTGGLGYGTGAGGTVTQATSKATAVTLNKPTGKITMHNAALAAGNRAGFSCNNTLVTANDIIVASIDNTSPASSGYNYSLSASAGTGAIVFVIKNETGGSLSDAVVINFAIIKGATA